MNHVRNAVAISTAVVSSAALVSFAGTAFSAVTAASETVEAVQNITIDVVNFSGTSCNSSTALAAISPDAQAITLIYSDYLVRSGQQRSCTATLRLNIPDGLSYAIVSAHYYGIKRLSAGTTATLSTSHRFAGGPAVTNTWNLGGQGSNWYWDVKADLTALPWSLCGEDRYFVVTSKLTMGAAPASDYVSTESPDLEYSAMYELQWQAC